MAKLLTKMVLPEKDDDKTSCLLGSKFYIKDYQRGYRWEAKQIEDLLNDIDSFDDDNQKLKYCLQPLIVKPIVEIESKRSLSKILNINYNNEIISENSLNWELIDGQQRLTTIWLILNCCNSAYNNPDVLPYSIYYETERNVDNYYLGEAMKIIENWFLKFGVKANTKKGSMKQKIEECIQFIWYEVPNETDSEDIFQKINNGKIALTNAELFKALLLNVDSIPYNETTNKAEYDKVKNYMAQIAFEWDNIEQSLNDNDFWGFISNDTKITRPQIDFLLEIRARQLKEKKLIDENISERDSLFPFLAINSYLNKDDNKSFLDKQIELWEEIVQIHDILKTWYKDRELYHYIGFLIAIDEKNGEYIKNLISNINGLKNSQIKEKIIDNIKNVFKNVKLDNLDYKKNKKDIKNVLLFFNIYTMIQSETDSKFSFRLYKENSWDIEHIHARKTEQEIKQLKDKKTMIELLEDLKQQFEQINFDKQIKEIDVFISNLEKNDKKIDSNDFFEFYRKMTDVCGGDFDENYLGNLTLLDYQTNRSYHNKLFPIKREIIIERDKGEVFIPVCTKNVFLKMYSKNVTNYMQWSKEDAEYYFNEIKKTLEEDAKIWK